MKITENNLSYFQYNEVQKAFHSEDKLNVHRSSDWKLLGRIDYYISSSFISYINKKYESNRPDFETIKNELTYYLRRN